MSGEFKPVPAGTESLASIQLFRETCGGERQRHLGLSSPAEPLDLAKVRVFNRSDGDGRFELLYQDDAEKFLCAGQWHWRSQELLLRSGKVGEKTRPLAGYRIEDSCRATEALVGKTEFSGEVCREGGDPRFALAAQSESLLEFSNYCSERLEAHGQGRFGVQLAGLFDLKQSRIENSRVGDGFYSLVYENRANNFFCEGYVDAGARQLYLRSGDTKDFETGGAEDAKVTMMNDACAFTESLFGKDELGNCKDISSRDLSIEEYLGFGFQATLGILSSIAFYRLGKRIWNTKTMGFLRALPFLRHLGKGLVTGAAFDYGASLFVDEDHALRRYGTPVAGLVGMAAPEFAKRTLIGQRLAATTFGARALPWASRLTWGLAAVGVTNWIAKKIMDNSDYDSSVNRRVTDRVYTEDGLYELEWWDLIPVHLALKGLRRGCRAVAPDMMEGAVTWDNESVEAEIRAEDKQHAAEAADFLKNTLPAFLHAENPADFQEAVALLRDQVLKLSDAEEEMAESLAKDGYVGLRVDFPQLSDEEAENFCRKFLLKQVQDAAAFMVFIPGAETEWARAYFNKDGTLKGEADAEGYTPAERLKHRWAGPESEKTTETSEAYELLSPMADMA